MMVSFMYWILNSTTKWYPDHQRKLFLSEINSRDNNSGYWGEQWHVLSPKTNRKFLIISKLFQVNLIDWQKWSYPIRTMSCTCSDRPVDGTASHWIETLFIGTILHSCVCSRDFCGNSFRLILGVICRNKFIESVLAIGGFRGRTRRTPS